MLEMIFRRRFFKKANLKIKKVKEKCLLELDTNYLMNSIQFIVNLKNFLSVKYDTMSQFLTLL